MKNVDITINGQNANQFFGQKLVAKELGNGVVSYRVNQVDFPKTGNYTVRVSATDADGTNAADARYKVVQEKAQKPAKNVILFIGDGMSLQAREMARIISKA